MSPNERQPREEDPQVNLGDEAEGPTERQKDEARRRARTARRRTADAGMPEPDIQVFMAGLYTQTLMAMGSMPGPDGQKEKNLPEAEYLIDTIAMLSDKTEGNLTEEESTYVENILYDLRMRYISAAGEQSAPPSEPQEGKNAQ